MKKKLSTAALCLVVSLALGACGGNGADGTMADETDTTIEEASQATSSNTVVVAMDSGLSTLDPGYVCEKYPPLIINACYENLFKFYSNDSAPEPCLADTYEFSEGGLTLTVKLKQDATFASGSSIISADVLFSVNRCKNLQGNPSLICDTIENMEAPDDYTVMFHLIQPNSAILSKLIYSPTAVLDSAVVKEYDGTDAEDASSADTVQSYLDTASAGSGIYAMTGYIPSQEVVLERNSNYWREATNVGKFIIRMQPDANTWVMILSGGDIDVAMNMTGDTISELKGAENTSIINGTTKTVGFVAVNMGEAYSGLMSNPQVRNAIHKTLDYTGIQTIRRSDTITPYDIIQVNFMRSKGERPAGYTNLEEARALLAEAGYSDGFDVDLTVTDLDMEGILLTDLTQKIRDDLSRMGINVNIVLQPWATGYGDAYRDGTLGFTVMYWGTDYNDPSVQLEFPPGGVVGKRARWGAGMDPELAAMYEKTTSATDNDARIAVLEEVQDAMYERGPFIMVTQAPSHIGYNARLKGAAISDPYALDLTLINVK